MKYISAFSAFSAMLLFPTAFHICEHFYPSMGEIEKWRLLRDCLHGTLIFLLTISCTFKKNKLTIASMGALVVMTAADIIDRVFFKRYYFDGTDWPVFMTAAIVFFYLYKFNEHGFSTR